MTEPLVSIVLPTFNGSRYLEQAIQSCLDQTYNNWELIIVDDASTDRTPEIIARHVATDSRVRSLRHTTNRRLPGALNTGFAQAKGDYLTWTSDDNLYRPPALAEMVDLLERESDTGIVYTDFTMIDELGNRIISVEAPAPEELATHNCVGPCFLYRRVVHERVGGYAEDLFLAEDYDFWLRASNLFRLRPLHKNLYLYRRHPASLTDLQARQIRIATELALARNLPQMHWLGNRVRASGYVHLATMAELRNDSLTTWKCLWHAALCNPRILFTSRIAGLLIRSVIGKRVRLFSA